MRSAEVELHDEFSAAFITRYMQLEFVMRFAIRAGGTDFHRGRLPR